MTRCLAPLHRGIGATLLGLALSGPALAAAPLFFDDFDTLPGNAYQAVMPDAPWRYQARFSTATYVGASQARLEQLDGASVLRLNDRIDSQQRKGWSSTQVFDTSRGLRLEARFNTLTQSFQTGIDELLTIWLIDAGNQDRWDFVGLSAPSFGADRIFTSMSSLNGDGLDTRAGWRNNTWYRLVLQATPQGHVSAALLADDGRTRLMSADLGHTLADYGAGVRLGFSQSMGQPGFPAPTDSALDYLRLTTAAAVPEPATLALFLAGGALLGGTVARRRARRGTVSSHS
ncbi:PEP-CTERM sorting domain-containing protein [Azohydromonas aeria]|uniref:PEP-CTERM sorting domain-containing protein n=1 Tax=Azohydromonas aeria TaxID=2590212 RepID=UPI0012F7EEA9|nr:PEP-CTERM sorting domain-containing protein [Azohydromonas aeria]